MTFTFQIITTYQDITSVNGQFISVNVKRESKVWGYKSSYSWVGFGKIVQRFDCRPPTD